MEYPGIPGNVGCTASTICVLKVQEESNDRFTDCAIGLVEMAPFGFHEDENKRTRRDILTV